MKAIFYSLIIVALHISYVSAQTSTLKDIRNEVIDTELLKNWSVGQAKTIKNQTITKLKDNGDGTTRTNVMYSLPSHDMFMNPTLMVMPIAVPKSGTIYIMVDRTEEAQANASNFTIRLYDNSGTVEIFSARPENSPGKEFKYGIWFNQFGVEIPQSVGNEFNVVVLDHTTGKSVTYHVEGSVEEMANK
ncbi:hypothetical protein BH09BAC1_BH09BAC1_01380 [soil metagenome]